MTPTGSRVERDSKPLLTVLTDPLPVGRARALQAVKRWLRPLRDRLASVPGYARHPVYRGHFAVTRSLIEGLRTLAVPANYNPRRVGDLGVAVVVLSSVEALRQAIGWKRSGMIGRLLAGPNLVEFPSDAEGLLAAPEVDLCLVPSEWVASLYQAECRELIGRCFVWAAGVDTTFWTPGTGREMSRRVVVFQKHEAVPDVREACLQELQARGYRVETVEYGTYTQEHYLSLLQSAEFLVGFSLSESQGIAWAEAWACDVPTLLWRQDSRCYRGRVMRSSSAPYLSPATGRFFSSVAEFSDCLSGWRAGPPLAPRRWVLEHMSDRVCAERLMRVAVDD